MSALNGSHVVIATEDVARMEKAFRLVFGIEPHYSHKEFVDFVLPGHFRVAFFLPVGAAAKFFVSTEDRRHIAVGITVKDVDAVYAIADSQDAKGLGCKTSGPPKEHPWGEKSFLLIDGDGNRWEVTQSPTKEGHLVNR